jgi:hypothetical protein
MKTTSTLLAKKIHADLYPDKALKAEANIFDLYINDISIIHPDCSKLLSELKISDQQIKFFKADKEMRIKFPDIWKMQLDQEENKLKNITQKLIDFGIKNQLDIAGYLEAIDNERNNFNDLFRRQEI